FGHCSILVCPSIIEEIAIAVLHHSLDNTNVGYLSDLLPFLFWRKDGLIGSGKDLPWIFTIENNHSCTIHKLVVSAVIDKHNTVFGEKRWRTRFNHARIEHTYSAREYGCLRLVGPVQKIVGRCESHLIRVIRSRAQVIHPVLTSDFFRNNGAGLGPLHVPISFVGRKNDPLRSQWTRSRDVARQSWASVLL